MFQKLRNAGTITHDAAPLNFGITLVLLGIVMLIVGILYHIQFMLGLRHERNAMRAEGLIHGDSHFPPSVTLIAAVILLIVGVFAIASMLFEIGPFR